MRSREERLREAEELEMLASRAAAHPVVGVGPWQTVAKLARLIREEIEAGQTTAEGQDS